MNSSSNNNKNSLTPIPPSTSYQYKKASSILKKYANFTLPSSDRTRKNDNQNAAKDTPKSNIPKCKTLSKCSPNESPEPRPNSSLRYTSPHKFSGPTGQNRSNDNAEPLSCSATHQQSVSDFVTFVTRATSPTPPHVLCTLVQPKRNEDDGLFFEAPRRRTHKVTQNNSSQTSDEEKPSSRVAALSSKFSSSPASCSLSRYPATRVGNYAYTRPTDLPIRSTSLTRSYPSPDRLEAESLLSPSVQHLVCPIEQRLQSTSPLSTLNKSLNNLAIADAADSDTEDESSYNEDYPMHIGKESCSLIVENASTELSDKPPKYPLSPNLCHRKIPPPERFRTSTSSSCSSTRHDSSGEDFCDKAGSADRNIPPPPNYDVEQFDAATSRNEDIGRLPKLFPLRRMDSADQPWWGNSSPESQPLDTGSVIRKMDSTEFLWSKDPSELSSSKSVPLGTSQSESEGLARWFNTSPSYSNASPSNSSHKECQEPSEPSSSKSIPQGTSQSESEGIARWFNTSPSYSNASCSNASHDERREPLQLSNSKSVLQATSQSESEGLPRWFTTSPSYSNVNHSNGSHVERRDSSGSQQNGGFVIRKMDSFDNPWWCTSLNEASKLSRSIDERDHASSAPTDDECRGGFAIRKMDSNEILWCHSEESASSQPKTENASLSHHSDDFSVYKIRKFDSSDRECWAEDERSKTGTPDWWNSKDDSESVESYKRSQKFRIKKIEPVGLEQAAEESSQHNGYRIQKIDSGERPWWMGAEIEQPSAKSAESGSSDGMVLGGSKFGESSNYQLRYIDELENLLLYIGKYTNIDDLLGTEVPPPAAPRTPTTDSSSDEDAGNLNIILILALLVMCFHTSSRKTEYSSHKL